MARCVHCLCDLPNKGTGRTKDHAPPRAWYPVGVPGGQRPTAPSCPGCNEEMRKVEDAVGKLRRHFIGDPRPYHAALGATELRAMMPRLAKNERDRRHRALKREQYLREVEAGRGDDGKSHPLPGFQVHGLPSVRLKISRHPISRFAIKMARVLTHWRFGEYIALPQTVTACPVTPDALDRLTENPVAERFEHGEGLVSAVVPLDGGRGRFWVFRVWDHWALGAIAGQDPADYGMFVTIRGGVRWMNGRTVADWAIDNACGGLLSSPDLVWLLR